MLLIFVLFEIVCGTLFFETLFSVCRHVAIAAAYAVKNQV